MAKHSKKSTTSATGRLFRLTGMTTRVATRVAGHQMKSWFRSDDNRQADREALMEHIGKEVAATLGELKGAVMKVGQIASQMQDILPPQISEQLKTLQNDSTPMPYPVIRQQVEKQLGAPIDTLFNSFDEAPFAAASIGQVHRATTLDGDPVVVKVQYPAVRQSIDSDIKQLRRILRLGSLLKVDDRALEAVFKEIRGQLHEELDYRREAENLLQFRDFHRRHPWVVIPEPFKELSSECVLTLSVEDGTPLDQVNAENGFDHATRNQLGERLFNALSDQLFSLRAVHGDPHPGNFAFRPDGSIVFYDFGAIKRLSRDDTRLISEILQAAMSSNWSQLDARLMELGARKKDTEVSDDFYATWVNLLLQAFSKTPFDFANSEMHLQLMAQVRKTPFEQMLKFQPSSRTLLVERVVSGHYWTMKKLGVVAAFRPLLDDALQHLHDDEEHASPSQ